MKCQLREYESCFSIFFEAETKDEAIKLARFGTGRTKDLRFTEVYFSQDGRATADVTIGKKKSGTGTL